MWSAWLAAAMVLGFALMLTLIGPLNTLFADAPVYLRALDESVEKGSFDCVEPPLCFSPRLTLLGRLACLLRAAPLSPGTAAYLRYHSGRVRQLVAQMVQGQYATSAIVAAVQRKLRNPTEPLIMHFAGDNGVGKTRTAEAVSLALAQRCSSAACTLGDSTLVLSGTAYDGMSLAEFRAAVVPAITRLVNRYPLNGVLIINDLTALEVEKVRLLLPVLGRSRTFPEDPSADLARLTVIVTSDFGREGRTRGRSVEEVRAFIHTEFQQLYSKLATSNLQTFPFLPVSLQTAAEIARTSVAAMACTLCGRPAILSADAAQLVVEQVKPALAAENGRAVAQVVAQTVGPLLDITCIDARDASVDSSAITVDVDDQGEFSVVFPPP